MAPLASTNSSDLGDWALLVGALGTMALAVGMLVSLAVCGCCGNAKEEPPAGGTGKQSLSNKEKDKGKDGSQRSSKSKKSRPMGKVDVKELAARYRVSEPEMQTYIDRFKAMDVNGDGCVTAAELVEMMGKLDQPISPAQADKFIKQYDKSGDGSLSLEEFLTMVTRRKKWSQPEANKMQLQTFKSFDKDGDGFISPQELALAMADMGDPINVQEAAEMIKMADKNKDGRISHEEFVEFWKGYAVG